MPSRDASRLELRRARRAPFRVSLPVVIGLLSGACAPSADARAEAERAAREAAARAAEQEAAQARAEQARLRALEAQHAREAAARELGMPPSPPSEDTPRVFAAPGDDSPALQLDEASGPDGRPSRRARGDGL